MPVLPPDNFLQVEKIVHLTNRVWWPYYKTRVFLLLIQINCTRIINCTQSGKNRAITRLEIFVTSRPLTKPGSDSRSDFGSDQTGIFAIDAELLFWEKLFSQRHRWLGIRNNGSDILSVIRLLTTSRRYRTLLIPAILIIVSSEIFREAFSLGSVKNGRSNRVKLCSRKFPSADQLKIILCDGFRAYGEF